MIEAFVESPIAPRMAAAAVRGDLYRERPFVMQHQMEASGGTVLVQGIIDVFWMENDKIILLDYKTDRVKQAQELFDALSDTASAVCRCIKPCIF